MKDRMLKIIQDCVNVEWFNAVATAFLGAATFFSTFYFSRKSEERHSNAAKVIQYKNRLRHMYHNSPQLIKIATNLLTESKAKPDLLIEAYEELCHDQEKAPTLSPDEFRKTVKSLTQNQ